MTSTGNTPAAQAGNGNCEHEWIVTRLNVNHDMYLECATCGKREKRRWSNMTCIDMRDSAIHSRKWRLIETD